MSAVVEDFKFSDEETAKSGWEQTKDLILQGMIVEFMINEFDSIFAQNKSSWDDHDPWRFRSVSP